MKHDITKQAIVFPPQRKMHKLSQLHPTSIVQIFNNHTEQQKWILQISIRIKSLCHKVYVKCACVNFEQSC